MIDVLRHASGVLGWSVVSLIFSAVLFPYFKRMTFGGMSWIFCRLGGATLLAALNVWPSFLGAVPVTPLSTFFILAALAAAAPFLTGISYRGAWREVFSRENLREESILLSIALFFVAIGLFNPNLGTTGERLRDAAYWIALATQRQLPLLDPWLAGEKVPYYLMGYVAHAQTFQYLPLSSLITYNVALAVTPALYALGLRLFFGLCFRTRRLAWLSALVVLLASNLRCVSQAFGVLFQRAHFNYWASSRVLPGTINEFPLWSASFGDLHAHVMALWVVPTFCAFGVAAWLRRRNEGIRLNRAEMFFLSLLTSWIFGINPWEFPICFGLSSLLILGLNFKGNRVPWLFDFAVYLLGFILLSLPHFFGAAGQGKFFGWVTQRTTMFQMIEVFGHWFLPLVALIFYRLAQLKKMEWLWSFALALLLPFVFQSAFFGLILLAAATWFCFATKNFEDQLLLTVVSCGLLLLSLCEVGYLRDSFGGEFARMNTVFKLYLPAWSFLGMGAMLAWKELFRVFAPTVHRPLVRSFFTLWLVLGASYLLVGLRARTNNFTLPTQFDGWGEIQQDAPDDARLVQWMAMQVGRGELAGHVLEAPSGAYQWPGRVGSFTGLSTYVVWEGYSYWWQMGLADVYLKRWNTLKKIFDGSHFKGASSCADFAKRLLDENLDYVFFGKYEKAKFSPPIAEQMKKCLTAEKSFGETHLYSVRSGLVTR